MTALFRAVQKPFFRRRARVLLPQSQRNPVQAAPFSSVPAGGHSPVNLSFLHFPASSASADTERTPVVFIHGLLGSSINFRTICKKKDISGSRDAYSVDLRNHGASPHHADMSWDVMALDTKSFLESQKIQKAHVVGHSLGGKVAMATALLFPDIVERLVVVDIAPVDYRRKNREYQWWPHYEMSCEL